MLIDALTAHQLALIANEGPHYNITEVTEGVITRAVNEQIMLAITKGLTMACVPNPHIDSIIRRLQWCGYKVEKKRCGYYTLSFVQKEIQHAPYWKDPEIMPAEAAFIYSKIGRYKSTGPSIENYLWGERLRSAVENKIIMCATAGRFQHIVQATLDDDIKWDLREFGFKVDITADRYLKKDGYPRRRDRICW